jgi:hypothetical protein
MGIDPALAGESQMQIKFTAPNGSQMTGLVLWTGFYDVDKPESHEVCVEQFPHVRFWVPVETATIE